jgi:C4-dicarboxylate-specific signal transduction histidine kinase
MRCRRLEKQFGARHPTHDDGEELAASLAHELNQPLSSILANAQTARHLVDSKGRKAVCGTRSCSGRDRNRMIGGPPSSYCTVRGFLKPESGHQTLVRPNHLVKESVELLHSELNRKGIEVCLALAPGLPDIPWPSNPVAAGLSSICF